MSCVTYLANVSHAEFYMKGKRFRVHRVNRSLDIRAPRRQVAKTCKNEQFFLAPLRLE